MLAVARTWSSSSYDDESLQYLLSYDGLCWLLQGRGPTYSSSSYDDDIGPLVFISLQVYSGCS